MTKPQRATPHARGQFQSTPSVWRETAKLHSFPLKIQQSKCNFDKKEHRYTSPCQKKYFFSDFFTKKQVRIPPAFFGSFANVGVGENDAVSGRIKCVQHSEKFS